MRYLENRLKNRFVFMGILNAVFAPFIILYLLMYSFFRYFEVSQNFSCDC
jgi:autophagy-related protein 9